MISIQKFDDRIIAEAAVLAAFAHVLFIVLGPIIRI